jgi:hypothetical protein
MQFLAGIALTTFLFTAFALRQGNTVLARSAQVKTMKGVWETFSSVDVATGGQIKKIHSSGTPTTDWICPKTKIYYSETHVHTSGQIKAALLAAAALESMQKVLGYSMQSLI